MEKQKKQRHIVINGQLVHLNPSQQQAWDKLINDVRNEARITNSCTQPDYHLCTGDCGTCPWKCEGLVVSLDGVYLSGNHDRVLFDTETPESLLMVQETMKALLLYARKAYPGGSEILHLHIVNGLTMRGIEALTGIPRATVSFRLRKMLTFIRAHRSDFFE